MFHICKGYNNRYRIGLNIIINNDGKSAVLVIPLFPWLSAYDDYNTGDIAYGWRVYRFYLRVRRAKYKKWFFSFGKGFVAVGKQRVLLSCEAIEMIKASLKET